MMRRSAPPDIATVESAAFGANSRVLPWVSVTGKRRPQSGLTFLITVLSPVRIGPAGSNPLVNFGNLELPQSTDSMSRQVAPVDPSVDRVPGHPEVLCEVIDRRPRLRHLHWFALEQGMSLRQL